MATTQQARLPATSEFDANLSKLYNKALTEVNRHLKKTIVNLKLDLNTILLPTVSESENKRVARQFTKKRMKILNSLDTLIRNLVVQRNRISLFDMFDQNNPMSKSYRRRYNRVKMTALARLETGVSLIKFERRQDMPLSTILFPSRNTNLYTIRYELLKHALLTKVDKGVKNLSFVHETWWGRTKRKFTLEKNKAEIPINAFLIPTPNTRFFAMRYNWSKHVLLSKVHKGIKNLRFVATAAQTTYGPGGEVVKTKMKPVTTQLDVPIDSFLFPSGNTWYYAARFELAKLKLLRKVKKGINAIEFTGGKFDVLEKFLPDTVNGDIVTSVVAKSLSKAIGRESKSRASATKRNAKTNEFAVHKQQKRMDRQLKLDEERNKILMDMFMGKAGGVATTMRKGKDGGWSTGKSGGMGGLLGGGITQAIISKGPAIARAIGPALAVAAAGAIGYGIGSWLDKQLGISNLAGEISSKVTTWFADREFVNGQMQSKLSKDSSLKYMYTNIGESVLGSRDISGAPNDIKREIFEKALIMEQARRSARQTDFEKVGYSYTLDERNSLTPVGSIMKQARGEKIEMMNTGLNLPQFSGGVSQNAVSPAQFNVLISETQKSNELLKDVQGTTIINSRLNPNENLSGLDNRSGSYYSR